MSQTNFEKLEIYQLAERLSDMVWTVALQWDGLAKHTVAPQVVRSVDSIGDKDYLRFLKISRGSLYETKHWLRLAFSRKLLSETQIKELKPVVDELTPKLNSYIRVVSKTKPKGQSPKTEAP